MSLSKEAIVHLQLEALSGQLSDELKGKHSKVPLIAMPSSFELQSLEQFMEHRSSYRYNFETKSIEDFAEYCEEFKLDGAKCFVDSDNMVAKTIFDLGTEEKPLHQKHTAKVKLDKTAAFKALLAHNGVKLSQKDASNFIEDWADNVVVYDQESKPIKNSLASMLMREVTIDRIRSIESQVDDYSENLSASEKIEARNKDKLPGYIGFTCETYNGLGAREFTVRLSILTSSDKPIFVMRIVKLEAHEEDIAKEFKEVLSGEITIQTLIGS